MYGLSAVASEKRGESENRLRPFLQKRSEIKTYTFVHRSAVFVDMGVCTHCCVKSEEQPKAGERTEETEEQSPSPSWRRRRRQRRCPSTALSLSLSLSRRPPFALSLSASRHRERGERNTRERAYLEENESSKTGRSRSSCSFFRLGISLRAKEKSEQHSCSELDR